MNWFRNLINRNKLTSHKSSQTRITTEQAKNMLLMIERTQEHELTCDEVHALLDQYVELTISGENADDLLPLIHYHLDLCPDCKEEYEALTRILQAPKEQ